MTPGLLRSDSWLTNAVAEVLDATAKRIDRDGFAQRAVWDPDTGLYCTRGAYTQVALDQYGGTRWWLEIIDGCEMAVRLHLGQGVATWNDQPGRTKIEVVEALTKTAAEVRVGCAA